MATRYDYQTVGANNEPCDGWCVVKYADNCHPQKIAEGLTRSEAATFAAVIELLAVAKAARVCVDSPSNATLQTLEDALDDLENQ